MRKFLIGFGAVLMLPVAFATAAAAAPPPKIDVCHVDDDAGNFELINVSSKAADAHEGHGDGVPGGEVPGMDGATFDEECGIVETGLAKAGCFAARASGMYFLTDGTNPQITGGTATVYDEPTCTNEFGSTNVRALIWAMSRDEALAICVDSGGRAVGAQGEPYLYVCV